MTPMWTTIVAALISAGASLIICLINNAHSNKVAEKKHDETITLIDYKLSQLTKQVEKHNQVVERVYKLERDESIHEEQIKVANHRISDLEKEENK